jgi:hypothetical protein
VADLRLLRERGLVRIRHTGLLTALRRAVSLSPSALAEGPDGSGPRAIARHAPSFSPAGATKARVTFRVGRRCPAVAACVVLVAQCVLRASCSQVSPDRRRRSRSRKVNSRAGEPSRSSGSCGRPVAAVFHGSPDSLHNHPTQVPHAGDLAARRWPTRAIQATNHQTVLPMTALRHIKHNQTRRVGTRRRRAPRRRVIGGRGGRQGSLVVAYVRIVALVNTTIRPAVNNYRGGVNQSGRFRVAALMSGISVAPS